MLSPNQILLGGAPEGFDARLVAREAAQGARPVIHVARDDKRMEAMRAALAFFAPDAVVLTLPAWDCLPYDRISPNPEISARADGDACGAGAGPAGRVHPADHGERASRRASGAGGDPRVVLHARGWATGSMRGGCGCSCRGWGSRPSPTVDEPGDFAVRGGIVDIYPPGPLGPVRLDLFGDVLDGARRFDPETQRTIEKLAFVESCAGVGGDPGRRGDHAVPPELPGRVRRPPAPTTRSTRR